MDWTSILLITVATTVVQGTGNDPCDKYHILDMYEGQRHVNFTPPDPLLHDSLCDQHMYSSSFWYRLVHNNVNYELANECHPVFSCGTLAPIWMVGNYPTTAEVTTQNSLCTNHDYQEGGAGQCTCQQDWADGSKKVDVRLCEDGHGGDFYIHRFDDIPACPSSFCVQDHPEGKNVHEGDTIKCDEKDGDCSSITIVLDSKISGLSQSTVFCNFVPVDKNIQNHIQETTWKTTTTVQCSLPTTVVNGETIKLFGVFSVHVVQTYTNGDPSVTKKSAEALIFDSTCQTCDFNAKTCNLKDNMCFVNGQCCQGSQCNMCETDTSTVIDIDTTASPSPVIDTDTTASTTSIITSANPIKLNIKPMKTSKEDGSSIIWVLVAILAAVVVVALCVIVVVYVLHARKKQRQINNGNSEEPPPYSPGHDVPYTMYNAAYGVLASGGNQTEPVKTPLNVDSQNAANETQYVDNKMKQERAGQVLANERQSDVYSEIPDGMVAQGGILPSQIRNRDSAYSLAKREEDVYENEKGEEADYQKLEKRPAVDESEHIYSRTLTPVSVSDRVHSVPNHYDVSPSTFLSNPV